MVAPASWSTPTTGTDSSGPASTATSGTRGVTCSSAFTADFCGAMTMMPSAPWFCRRWTAPSTEERLKDCRLPMVMA